MAWADNQLNSFNNGGFNSNSSDNKWYSNRSSTASRHFTPQSLYGNTPSDDQGSEARTKISDLFPGNLSACVVGVVITKEDPRCFPSKKDPMTDRWLLSFTLRDTPQDFINATAWGADHYIKELAEQFKIGDVVEIKQTGIQTKAVDGSDEKFRPWTPSMYQLNLGEHRGIVSLYHGPDLDEFNKLSHVPVKAHNDYYTIGDILANGQALHGEIVSILACVQKVCPYKDITTKGGRQMKRCEVKLFDETAQNFPLVLWTTELIFLAQNWAPKEADVKITKDEYKKAMIATAMSKTIIIVNPDTRESLNLFKYCETAQLTDDNLGDSFTGNNIDVSSIKDRSDISDLKAKAGVTGDGGVEHCYAFAAVTLLDIDTEDPYSVVSVKCTRCRYRVSRETGLCVNTNCPQGSLPDLGRENTETETLFDTRMSCTDHTGTITGCYISGEVLEKLLGCTVEQFLVMDEIERTNLKWTILLERCKVYFKVNLPTFERPNATVRILSCQRANIEELTQALT